MLQDSNYTTVQKRKKNKNKIEKEQRVVVKGGGWDREEEQIGGTQETFRPVKLLCKI